MGVLGSGTGSQPEEILLPREQKKKKKKILDCHNWADATGIQWAEAQDDVKHAPL